MIDTAAGPKPGPAKTIFGAVGDIHGDFSALARIMSRHPEVPFWLCPGDVAADDGRYPEPAAPLYWIKGNNEDFDFIGRETAAPGAIRNLHYIPNARIARVGALTIAGLGGTLAPTWYDTPASRLPAARAGVSTSVRKDDKRRHFVREEVEACAGLREVDVFMSHEAPRPFILRPAEGTRSKRPLDAGKQPINQVLAGMRPRLHLFGHHHRFSESTREQVRSIGLDEVSASYLVVEIDGESLEYNRFTKV
jgi:Icc-related predicted phosphoesterase